MDKKTKVLWIGDGGVYTGFSVVNHSIIENLPEKEYEIHHLAVNYRGDYWETVPWHRLYPAMLGGDYLGMNRIKSFVEKYKPDLIFVLNDLWVVADYVQILKEFDIPIVTYFPIDAPGLQVEWLAALQEVEVPVAYTNFGKAQLLETLPTLPVKVIPHGIDKEKFFPIDQFEARTKYMEGSIDVGDWIVLNANRNQPRKRIDLTIKGFCEFARNKPENVKLYLHMGLQDAGWRIDKLMNRFGQSKRLYITSPHLSPSNGVSVEVLNYIYNSSNVGINTSLGEGWGLVPFEHAATGAAQIVSDNSASAELFGEDRGFLIPVAEESITAPKILTEGTAPTVNSIAETLEYVYDNPEEVKERAKTMYDYISLPKFQWENIAMRWHELFQGVLG